MADNSYLDALIIYNEQYTCTIVETSDYFGLMTETYNYSGAMIETILVDYYNYVVDSLGDNLVDTSGNRIAEII